MLHPKSGKSKRGKYEYTHKVCICFPIIQLLTSRDLESECIRVKVQVCLESRFGVQNNIKIRYENNMENNHLVHMMLVLDTRKLEGV